MGLDYNSFKKTKAQGNKGEKPQAAWVKWTKFGVSITLYLLFLYWVESWMGLIVVPFIYDAYISKKIKWDWWKNLEGDVSRYIMSWVDAIVFALVAVYFVNQFFFQNYSIPSSSLEKSLLTGDYLLVSKVSYGPRIPQTPLTMPLTQHTMPLINCKSYIEWPHWDYRRVKGLGKIEEGDIVVFNFPAGDTVAVYNQQTFYDLCCGTAVNYYMDNGQQIPMPNTLSVYDQRVLYSMMCNKGRQILETTGQWGDIVSRPADRRDNYVKRCVGLPGQTLQIKDKVIYTDGKAQNIPDNVQFSYFVYTKDNMGDMKFDDVCRELGIYEEQRSEWNESLNTGRMIGKTGWTVLTSAAVEGLRKHTELVDSVVAVKDGDIPTFRPYYQSVYPWNHDYGWTRDNYGPVWIPKKGETLKLTLDNIAIYERCIKNYEGNDLVVTDKDIIINGKPATEYTFKMDYYWMMGDNRHNSADSRYWGFVPEDHIVGKPLFVWWSVSPDANSGHFMRIRWERLFKSVKELSAWH